MIEKDIGFLILLTEFRFNGLRNTVSTIKNNFDNPKILCVTPNNGNRDDIKVIKNICPAVEARNTISSMINVGIENSQKPWNLVLIPGTIIRNRPVMKYEKWLKSTKDVMYRVVDKDHWRWEDASIHGMLIHQNAIKEVGTFPEDEESLTTCKLLWGVKAIEKGYNFKGLVGVRLI